MRVNRVSFSFVLLFWVASAALAGEPTLKATETNVSDTEFRQRLISMLDKVDGSIHALREQIAESQSAPFLSDLYLQLAELLSQKSNTLYYVEMEKRGGDKSGGGFSSVVSVQKEAIGVYEKILKEFPATDKKAQIEYRIALALKSIDEIPAFLKAANAVVREYPGSDEAIRSELLLGQYAFEQRDFKEAMQRLGPAADSTFVFERNLARYRMGLILVDQEKYQAALDRFEQVITDAALKEQDNPYSVSLQSKSLKSDLKREALVDSVRAYTQLHAKGGDPVTYYSRIAPSELHFQEVIEKLAVRYIYLKNYESAVKLLRSLSERTADPQRVVNIYREVLLMIPVQDRAGIPVEEMRFVLDQYHRWISFFDIPEATKRDAHEFFEKQTRELATRNHSLSKEEKNSKLSSEYLARARDYYLLYLGNFATSVDRAKMAANLADVYFAQKDWVRSGEYYLRTYSGEFGPPEVAQRELLIGNAVLCLQKDTGDSFYETVRRRGLMIRALDRYIASSEQRKLDPKLAFLRAKTRYEQGVFPQALNELYAVSARFPASEQAVQAGEVILDYFNVRNDYEGLSLWSGKLTALPIADAGFRQKVASIQSQASSKVVQDQVQKVPGYDPFAQGRSYLNAAMAASDSSVAQTALREALAKSREERDIQTYLKTAAMLGDRETDPAKRGEILGSVANENRKIGRYYQALGAFNKIYTDRSVAAAGRGSAFESAVETAVLMRDWKNLAELSRDPLWKNLSSEALSRTRQGWLELLESPIQIPGEVAERFYSIDQSEEGLLALFKAQERLPSDLRERTRESVNQRCAGAKSQATVCHWVSLERLEDERNALHLVLSQATPAVSEIQKVASDFAALVQKYRAHEGSGDTQVEVAIQLRSGALYRDFSAFLKKVALANPDYGSVLQAKAAESEKSEQGAIARCKALSSSEESGNLFVPSCDGGDGPALAQLLHWRELRGDVLSEQDPTEEEIVTLQKKLFSQKQDDQTELELSKALYDRKDFHHSVALAAQGLAKAPQLAGEFKRIIGCSAFGLGYLQEAAFRLGTSGKEALIKTCGAIQ